MQTWQTQTDSQEETEALAAKVGTQLKGGEVIELVSDLGGGKTAFVRGLARGMGSDDHVASPTFTISREYHAGDLVLYHFDFYRLQDPGIMTDELAEVVGDQQSVVAVEWSDIVKQVLPEKRLTVRLKLAGETSREVEISYASELAYLLSAVIPDPIEYPVIKNSTNNKLDSGSSPE